MAFKLVLSRISFDDLYVCCNIVSDKTSLNPASINHSSTCSILGIRASSISTVSGKNTCALARVPGINAGYPSLEEGQLSTYLVTALFRILFYLSTAVTTQVVSRETRGERPSPVLSGCGGSFRCLPLKSGCPCHLGLLSGSSSYVASLPRRNR